MRFFSSDQHFYHKNVIAYCDRPFSSVEEMNAALISNWNSVVGHDDEVYCLGDFSMAFRPVEIFSHCLNGKKYLVPGNHDFCHSYHKKSRHVDNRLKWVKRYEDLGWTVLPEQTSLILKNSVEVVLSHIPRLVDKSHPANYKYLRWCPPDSNLWLLHGHLHSSVQNNLHLRMYDVGVDSNNFTPISEDAIIDRIKSNT